MRSTSLASRTGLWITGPSPAENSRSSPIGSRIGNKSEKIIAASTPSRLTAVIITSAHSAGFLQSSRKRNFFANRAILRHVAAGLTHQPNRRVWNRLTACRFKKSAVVGGVVRIQRGGFDLIRRRVIDGDFDVTGMVCDSQRFLASKLAAWSAAHWTRADMFGIVGLEIDGHFVLLHRGGGVGADSTNDDGPKRLTELIDAPAALGNIQNVYDLAAGGE